MIVWAVLASSIMAYPFWREHRRLPMNEQARGDAPGGFLHLTRGMTHYRWYGSDPMDTSRPLVVCVHGLTTPSFVFEGLAERLVARGYNVLGYDHYGRGYSDRPKMAQDRTMFVHHLNEILTALGIDQPFDLLGYSMGGWVASAFAADCPDRIKRLILLAPAGMGHDLGSLTRRAANIPVLGEWLFYSGYPNILRHGAEAERTLPGSVPHIVDRQMKELSYRGFLPSVLASLRGALAQNSRDDHRAIHAKGLPVTAVWGRDDAVIPIACRDTLADWNPDATHIVVDGAGHGVTYTHTDAFTAVFD